MLSDEEMVAEVRKRQTALDTFLQAQRWPSLEYDEDEEAFSENDDSHLAEWVLISLHKDFEDDSERYSVMTSPGLPAHARTGLLHLGLENC